jgi:flagellar biosynthetic protein FliO
VQIAITKVVPGQQLPCGENRCLLTGRQLVILALTSILFGLGLTGPLPAPASGQELMQEQNLSAEHQPAGLSGEGELQQTTSLVLAIIKALAALALVLGLIILLTVWLKKMGWGTDHPGHGSLIKVLETRTIAPKKYVAVLQIAGELVVVGVTDQQINLLTRLEPDDALAGELASRRTGASALTGSFAALLRKARGNGNSNDNGYQS